MNPSMIRSCCCIGAASVEVVAAMATMAIKCPHLQFHIVDTSEALINAWSNNLPNYNNLLPLNASSEPGLSQLLDKACKVQNNLCFSTHVERHVSQADIIFISAQAPTKTRGIGAGKAMDCTQLEATARIIAQVSTSHKIIVEKSSVPVKTADYIQRILKSCCEDKGLKFHILSNPDFTTEGSVVHDLMNPDRVLIGANTEATHAARILINKIYSHWVPRDRILTTNLWSAELSKLTASAMAAQRISSMNAISALCEAVGAHVSDVANAVGMDSRIGHGFLQDFGLSFSSSSSTFKKDILSLVYICESYGLSEVATYWNQVLLIDDYQKLRFVKRTISSMFGSLARKKIAVLGFATRNGSSDTTESPTIQVCHGLLEDQAHLSIYDPGVLSQQISSDLLENFTNHRFRYHEAVSSSNVSVACDPYEAVKDAHGICILTALDEFKHLDFQRIYDNMEKPAFIFDGQNVVKDAKKLHQIGFIVYSIGNPLDPYVRALPNQPRC